MIVYPAIDLKSGNVVRLLQGLADKETIYDSDPAIPALKWKNAGSQWVHVVDLDGAFTGEQKNMDAVKRILDAGMSVQLGGGIRSLETIEFWLKLGVKRVVVGTMGAQNPDFISEAVEAFSAESIAIGIDAKDGKVAIKGWVETIDANAVDFANNMAQRGIKYVIYTDISRDGMLTGPNFEAQIEMLKKTPLHLIASGGVCKPEDLDQFLELSQSHERLNGVITGKALYDGRIDLAAWLKANAS